MKGPRNIRSFSVMITSLLIASLAFLQVLKDPDAGQGKLSPPGGLVKAHFLASDESKAVISNRITIDRSVKTNKRVRPIMSDVYDKTETLVKPAPTTPTLSNYYMVFSTSCSEQQHWESLVFFYHAFKVQQPGNVTRIISGCNPSEKKAADLFFEAYIRPMSDRFHLHHTESFSKVQKVRGKSPYKYMNKPFGLRDWMEKTLRVSTNGDVPPHIADDVVMLLDPDMILLRPLVHDFTREDVEWVEQEPATKIVRTGYPIGQQDGYLNSKWVDYNFSHITGKAEHEFVPPPHFREGKIHWNSGPPYLATVRDMYNIASKWTEYAPRVVEQYPDIFAEMVGFIVATIQLKLPFTFIRSLAVSTTETKDREGWSYIDALPDKEVCTQNHTSPLPVVLHYCKRFMLGKWFFSKYRLKKNIMDCDKALLKVPQGVSFKQFDHAILPPRADLKIAAEERIEINPKRAKRELFMLCGLMNSVNEALRYHKLKKCGRAKANMKEVYTIHDDPTSH